MMYAFNARMQMFEWPSLKCRRTPLLFQLIMFGNENMWALINSFKNLPLPPVGAMHYVVSLYCFYLITGYPWYSRDTFDSFIVTGCQDEPTFSKHRFFLELTVFM